jgi:hypothetical protein
LRLDERWSLSSCCWEAWPGSFEISEATVKAHVTRILEELGVTDRAQAVTHALRRGFIHLE